jgi:FkbM family methyltransferase
MIRYLNLLNNISNWHLHFLDKFGFVKQDPLLFVAKNKVKVDVPKRIHHEFKEIFLENAYTIGLQKPVNPAGKIIDIGANAGYFSLFAASKFPQSTIFAYEPVKMNFVQLQKNKDLNPSKAINTFNQAVGGKSEMIKIYFDQTDSFSTSASIKKDVNQKENGASFEEVSCITLQEVFEQNQIDFCDLIKIDCEGAEYEILYNTPREVFDKIDQMALELHESQDFDIPSLKKYIKDMGFTLFEFQDKPHMLWAYKG